MTEPKKSSVRVVPAGVSREEALMQLWYVFL
jgi:hypothetical protein